MPILRNKQRNKYTVVDNNLILDKRLTNKSLGLLVRLLSLPDNWDFTEVGLCTTFEIKIASLRSALDDLESLGYLTRTRERDASGKVRGSLWTVHESPILGLPILEKPILENRILLNTKEQLNTKKQSNTYDNADSPQDSKSQPQVSATNEFESHTTASEYNTSSLKGSDYQAEAIEFMEWWNKKRGRGLKSTRTWFKNFVFYRQDYQLCELKAAVEAIKYDKFWDSKMTIDVFFRQLSPQGEPVDRVAPFLNMVYAPYKHSENLVPVRERLLAELEETKQ